jgi:hypothetical protein
MANRRYIDFPIASTSGDTDIILIWQGGANKQTTKATFLSGLPENLDELNDVAISGLTNGQILRYDSVTGKWENTDQGNLDLNDLNDVSIVSPSNGQVLVYNSSTSRWENSSGGYVPYTGAVTTVNLGAQTIQAGSFVKAGGTAAQFLKANGSVDSNVYGTGTVTSVALTMPSAFSVANSPITTAGTLAVTGAGTVGQYIRGDGSLADFPESSGGGSSVSYYLNGSVAQGTIGGVAYKELNKVPILGAGTDFTINADGYIASFITDAGDPNLLEIPGGNWNFETYFSASSSGGTPSFYVELYKVNSGGTATLIASNSGFPELIAFGTNIISYFSTLAVPTTALALTDRLAIRYYVTHSGRTITLHTEDNHLCQIITTFTTGLTSLNGLTAQVQNFAVGTSGTDFNIASATATHTFNLPTASATNRGALSSADWTTFNGKQNALTNPVTGTGTSGTLPKFTGASTIGNSLFTDDGTNGAFGGANYSVGTSVRTFNISSPLYTGLGFWANNVYTGDIFSYGFTGNLLINADPTNVFANTRIALSIDGTERFGIFSNGNVSIDNSPTDQSVKLYVNGTANINGLTTISGNITLSNGANRFVRIGSSTAYYYDLQTVGDDFQIREAGNTPRLTFTYPTGAATFSSSVTAASGSLFNANSATLTQDVLTVRGGGASGNFGFRVKGNNGDDLLFVNALTYNVIIGTTGGNLGVGVTPSSWDTGNTVKAVQINQGALWGYGTTNVYLASNYYWSGTNRIYLKTAAAAEYSITNGAHEWYTAASGTAGNVVSLNQVMRITSGGQIIATGTFTSSTAFSLQAAGQNGISDGPYFRYLNTSNSYQILKQINANTDEDTWTIRGGGWNKVGTLNATTGVYTALSDKNKKKDFEDSKIGLNAILGLKPTLYRMKDQEESEQKQLGFIAQEVKDFIPQAYIEQDNFIGLQDRAIMAALVKAIQEQQEIINDLKQKIQ